jgi:hypothetical protein
MLTTVVKDYDGKNWASEPSYQLKETIIHLSQHYDRIQWIIAYAQTDVLTYIEDLRCLVKSLFNALFKTLHSQSLAYD